MAAIKAVGKEGVAAKNGTAYLVAGKVPSRQQEVIYPKPVNQMLFLGGTVLVKYSFE